MGGPRFFVPTSPSLMPVDLPAPGAALPRPDLTHGGDLAGPAALYRERTAAGLIRSDPAQQRAVARLQQLHDALARHKPAVRRGLLARLGLGEPPPPPPRGLY